MDQQSSQSNPSPEDKPTGASDQLNLEEMIKGYMADITRLREKLKSQREMFNQSFEQDKVYSEVAEQQKAANRKKTEAKQRIVKTDAVSAVKMTMKEIQDELKDAQQALSDYLNRYIMVSNSNEFMGPDGELHQIVRTAKLVKKK